MSAKGKLLLVGVGVGIGYVLGARAGRERYDQIAAAWARIWHTPIVQKQVEFVGDRLDDAAEIANAGAKRLVDRIIGGKPKRKPAAAPPTADPPIAE